MDSRNIRYGINAIMFAVATGIFFYSIFTSSTLEVKQSLTITGWVILIVGWIFFAINHWLDKKEGY